MSRNSEAAQWFARMRGKDADSSRAEFDAWMSIPANAAAYAEVLDDWAIAEGISARRRAPASRAAAQRFAPGGGRWAMTTAAAIALALLFAWHIGRRGDVPQIASGPMLPGQLRLADGSVVTLTDGAWAEPQFTDGERRLRLHGGRARFEVAHDAARPFIVVAGNSETRALGTVFEVDTREPAPRIRLISGSVEVRLTGTTRILRLSPGESAEVSDIGPRRLPAMANPVAGSAAPATLLDADRLPLGAVIDRANKANAIPIHLADPALGALELTGQFDIADSVSLARKLAAALDLVAETRPGEILLRPREENRGG